MPGRKEGRAADEMRPIEITPHFTMHAEGSVLISTGQTRVLCTASVEDRIPHFLRGKGQGWVTGEYGMLPRSTNTRIQREASKGRLGGRTQEIQRLIGRSLRSVVDLRHLGERTIWIDCDVIQADGGTRTASISGAFVAVALALGKMKGKGLIKEPPLYDYLGAVSVGMIGVEPRLDLDYSEDSSADVDMNVVMTGRGYFVEVQGTAEKHPFSRKQMDQMMDLASSGIETMIAKQKEVLEAEVEDMGELMQTLKSFTLAPANRD